MLETKTYKLIIGQIDGSYVFSFLGPKKAQEIRLLYVRIPYFHTFGNRILTLGFMVFLVTYFIFPNLLKDGKYYTTT